MPSPGAIIAIIYTSKGQCIKKGDRYIYIGSFELKVAHLNIKLYIMATVREETLTEVFDLWLVYQQWDNLKAIYGLESSDDLPDLLRVVEEVNQEMRRLIFISEYS